MAQQTPRPQWSLPRAHYTTYTDSPSSESEASDDISDDDDCGKLPDGLGFTDEDKENVSIQHENVISLQQVITKPTTTTKPDQCQAQPIVSVVVDTPSREQQLLPQECCDDAMETMCSDAFSAISGGSETTKNKAASIHDDPGSIGSCEGQGASPTSPEFQNDAVSMTPSEDDKEEPIPSESFVQEESECQHSSNKAAVVQRPNESTTLSDYNCEGNDTLTPFPQQQRGMITGSPMSNSLSHSNVAPSETSSAVASSVATDLFAALRTTCSTVCGGENDEDITEENRCLSPIHHRQEACLTAERKRWIHKTLLSKREYTPYHTKEREECCKNKDSHELTTERKKWIEETLLTNPMAHDMLRKLSPKQTHSSYLAAALTEASNELFAQQQWQEEEEEPTLDAARDDSTEASPTQPPEPFHQQLDSSFLASALVATNMLLTPPRREKYSSKPSRPRMSIGATPLPFTSPFSPSSAASSAFTETASNIILHAIKKLTPKSSAKRVNKKQQKITPSRKSDLLSIVAEMDYFDKVGSCDRSDEEERSHCNQTRLVKRVEKLEKLITSQYSRASDNRQEEIDELRSELDRTKEQLDNERQLVEEANQRASMLMSDLKNAEEKHSTIERQLKEKIVSLEAEVDCLIDNQVDCLMNNQKQFSADEEEAIIEEVSSNEHADLDSLCTEKSEFVEMQRTAELIHSECKKDNENIRSQLLALSSERSERVQLLNSALENLESVSESYSCINQKLEQEVNAKKEEVACMQRSLELLSCELIESTNEVIDLQSENARLRDELKRFKASKKWQEFWLG